MTTKEEQDAIQAATFKLVTTHKQNLTYHYAVDAVVTDVNAQKKIKVLKTLCGMNLRSYSNTDGCRHEHRCASCFRVSKAKKYLDVHRY